MSKLIINRNLINIVQVRCEGKFMFFIQKFIIDLILLLQIKKKEKEKRKGECVCWFISEYVYFHT